MTTVEQRKAWAEVHKAITDYIINFGVIEVGRENECVILGECVRYVECGKIYTPDYKIVLDKKPKA